MNLSLARGSPVAQIVPILTNHHPVRRAHPCYSGMICTPYAKNVSPNQDKTVLKNVGVSINYTPKKYRYKQI